MFRKMLQKGTFESAQAKLFLFTIQKNLKIRRASVRKLTVKFTSREIETHIQTTIIEPSILTKKSCAGLLNLDAALEKLQLSCL